MCMESSLLMQFKEEYHYEDAQERRDLGDIDDFIFQNEEIPPCSDR